jgi:methionyl-tRNA formyltransferase
MKITLSTNGLLGVYTINKLFSLGYCPKDIDIWYSESNSLLADFCNQLNIKSQKILSRDDFDLLDIKGDLLLSMAGTPFLVPDYIINQFYFGGINLHPADTEKYRGRWMVSWCLINNEPNVAYTWHRMTSTYDTGNIILKQEFKILPKDTALSLNNRLLSHAVSNLETLLEKHNDLGTPPRTTGKYYNKDMPFQGIIDPTWPIDQIDRFIRAMYHPPYPPAQLVQNEKTYYVNDIDDYQNTCSAQTQSVKI